MTTKLDSDLREVIRLSKLQYSLSDFYDFQQAAMQFIREHGDTIEAEVKLRGWQDISTAPKDGRKVIISNGEAVGEAWYHESSGGSWWSQCDPTDAYDGSVCMPTHWMPLPLKPTGEL